MNGELRRQYILEDIQAADKPLSASRIAQAYQVSRQIIVGDIALLRASGYDIISTARGYLVPKQSGLVRELAMTHSPEETEDELRTFVQLGATVLDVTVEHPVYGQLTGHLGIASEEDIQDFLYRLESNDSGLLLSLTNGLHLHRIECRDEAHFEAIRLALHEKGYLYENN